MEMVANYVSHIFKLQTSNFSYITADSRKTADEEEYILILIIDEDEYF